jgi:RNA polymerase sigma-70 factor (ECF subfamily)
MTRDERDTMLVQACLQGDRSAFDELVDRYQRALYNAAFRITGSVDDAMDVTQSAFVAAYEKLHTFDPSRRFFSWIYRITCNRALRLVEKRRPLAAIDAEFHSTNANPEVLYDTTESGDFLERALRRLSADHRMVIVLKHILGFSYREISELLDIPEKTVKSRLFTARQRLRSVLLANGYVR